MIEFIQAHLVEILALIGLAVRLELGLAKLTKTTADDAIAEKIANAVKTIGIDVTKTP